MDKQEFENKVEDIKMKISSLPELGQQVIEATAERLQKLNYSPATVLDSDIFLRCSNEGLINEITRLAQGESLPPDTAPDSFGKILEHISVVHFYYIQLLDLRMDVPEAWDEVDELYVFD